MLIIIHKLKELFYPILFLTIVFITSFLLCCIITDGHHWGDDFASYIMQAKSIVEGNPAEFLTKNSFIIQHSTRIIGPNAYPWGFPMLLAPVYALVGLNFIILKIIVAIFLILNIALLWVGFEKYHSNLWRILLVALFAFNPAFLSEVNKIQSDIPFLFFSTLAILLIEKIKIEKNYSTSLLIDHIFLGFIILVASLIRTNGILLLFTVGLVDIVGLIRNIYIKNFYYSEDRIKHFFSICSTYIIFIVFLILINSFYPEGGKSHAIFLKMLSVQLVLGNLQYYLNLPVNFLSKMPYGYLFYILSIPVALFGLITFFKTRYYIAIYIFLTFILYIFWPPTQGLRFIFPVIPFYLSFVISGLENSEKFFKKTKFTEFLLILPILIILGYFLNSTIISSIQNLKKERYMATGVMAREAQEMFTYVKNNIPEEKIIGFFKPRAMRMMTNRTGLVIHNLRNIKKVDYLCLHLLPSNHLEDDQIPLSKIDKLIEQNQAKLIFKNKNFNLYEIIKYSPH